MQINAPMLTTRKSCSLGRTSRRRKSVSVFSPAVAQRKTAPMRTASMICGAQRMGQLHLLPPRLALRPPQRAQRRRHIPYRRLILRCFRWPRRIASEAELLTLVFRLLLLVHSQAKTLCEMPWRPPGLSATERRCCLGIGWTVTEHASLPTRHHPAPRSATTCNSKDLLRSKKKRFMNARFKEGRWKVLVQWNLGAVEVGPPAWSAHVAPAQLQQQVAEEDLCG
jgi:hypothetical protein